MAEAKASASSIYTSLTERLEKLEALMQKHRTLANRAQPGAAKVRHQANLASAEGRVAKIQAEAHAKLAELEQERAAIRNGMGTDEDYADVERGILAIKDILARHNKTAPTYDAFGGDLNDRSKGAKFTEDILGIRQYVPPSDIGDVLGKTTFNKTQEREFGMGISNAARIFGTSRPTLAKSVQQSNRGKFDRLRVAMQREGEITGPGGLDSSGGVHPNVTVWNRLLDRGRASVLHATVNSEAEKALAAREGLVRHDKEMDKLAALGTPARPNKGFLNQVAKAQVQNDEYAQSVSNAYGSDAGTKARDYFEQQTAPYVAKAQSFIAQEKERADLSAGKKEAALESRYWGEQRGLALKHRKTTQAQDMLAYREGGKVDHELNAAESGYWTEQQKLAFKNRKSVMSRDMVEKRYEDKAGQELYRTQYGVSDRVGGKLARIEAARSLAEESTGSVRGALHHQGNQEMVVLLKELVNIEKERGKLEKDNSSGQHNKAIEVLNQQRQSILTGVGPAQASLAKNGIQAFANKGIMGALGNIPIVGGALAGAFGGIASAGGMGAAIAGGGAAGLGAAALGALGLVAGGLAASSAAYSIGGAAREEEIQGYNVGNRLGTNGRLIDQFRPGMGAASEAFKRLGYKSSELMDFQANANVYGMSAEGQGKLAIAGGNLARQAGMGLDTTAGLASSFNKASGRSSDSSNVRDLFDMFTSSVKEGIKNGLGMGGEELANVIKGTFDQVSQNAGGYLDKGVRSNLIGSLQAAMPGDQATAANRVQRMAKIQSGIQQSEDAGLLGAMNERVKREMSTSGKSFADIALPGRSAKERKRLNEIYKQNSYLGVDIAKTLGGLQDEFGKAAMGIVGKNESSRMSAFQVAGLGKGDASAAMLGDEDLLLKLGGKATKSKADVSATPQSDKGLGKGSVIQEFKANEIKITGSKIVLVGTMPFVSGVQDGVTKSYGELNKAAQSFNGGANSFGEWVDKLVKLVFPGTPAPVNPKKTSFLDNGGSGYGDGKYAPRGGNGIMLVSNQSSSGVDYSNYSGTSTGTGYNDMSTNTGANYTAPPSTGGGTSTLPGGQKIKLIPGAPLPSFPLPGSPGSPSLPAGSTSWTKPSENQLSQNLANTAKVGFSAQNVNWMTKTAGAYCSAWVREVVEKSYGLANGALQSKGLFGDTAAMTYGNFNKLGVTGKIKQGIKDGSLTAGDILFRLDGPGKDGKYGTRDDPAGHAAIMGDDGYVYENYGSARTHDARRRHKFDPNKSNEYTDFADMETFNSRYMFGKNGQVIPKQQTVFTMAPIKVDISGNIKVDGIDDPALKRAVVTQLMPTIRAQVARMRA